MTLFTGSGSIPRHQYVFVDRSFLTNGQQSGWERAVWFGLHAVRGRTWGLQVMLESGAVFRELPPHAISWVDSWLDGDAGMAWTPQHAQVWDCYGAQFSTLVYDYLDGLECLARVQHQDLPGEYLFTVVPLLDPFTHAPDQSKEFMFLRLDNGRLTIQPTNRVVFRDKSFVQADWPTWPTHLRSSAQVYQCE